MTSNQWGIDEAFKTLERITGDSPAAKGAMLFLRKKIERQADPPSASRDRMQVLARFLRSQMALPDRPPVGRVELNNEEAEACASALESHAHEPRTDHVYLRSRLCQASIDIKETPNGSPYWWGEVCEQAAFALAKVDAAAQPICVLCAQPLSAHTPAQLPVEMFNPQHYVLKCPALTKGDSRG